MEPPTQGAGAGRQEGWAAAPAPEVTVTQEPKGGGQRLRLAGPTLRGLGTVQAPGSFCLWDLDSETRQREPPASGRPVAHTEGHLLYEILW